MNREIALDDAASRLGGLVASLKPGDEVVLIEGERPVAKLVPIPEGRTSWPCEPGSATEPGFWMADDFDAPLEDFREYME